MAAPAHAFKREARSTARIEARISPEQKEFFERAAEISGVTLTDFTISSLQKAAVQTLEEHSLITLSERAQRTFIDALLAPPEPNDALLNAARRHAGVRSR